MDGQETLSIYALGRVRVLRGDTPLTDWTYLDSAELLFYLLHHTRRPKPKPGQDVFQTEDLQGHTREQIGLELWPDASPQQLSSKLKSRLYDLRRVLGDGAWILFENGQYKFNATRPYWFDVEHFTAEVAEANRLRSNAPAQAIAHFQTAVQLYRGDYLADLRQRRVRKESWSEDSYNGSGREWHIAEQEHLLRAYLDALNKLGELLVGAESFEEAAEAYRLLVSKDDYDDDAHYGLIACLAQLGKRSQALDHYRRLLKRRGDTPPGPEMVQLAERLKRGEELAPRPAPPAAAPPARPAAEEHASAPFQVPTDLPRFVGRELEAGQLGAALTRAEPPRRFWLEGMGGIGKTSLAIHLAHNLRDQFPDGVLWAHVSTSEPLAILDSWARAFGCDFSGLPDLESRGAALRAVLADKKTLLILDDVWDAGRARSLLVGGPQATVLMTGRDLDLAEALDAQIVPVPVFAVDESHQLLARPDLRERVEAEPKEADEICRLLGHLPLALDIAAHRLASRPYWSLRELGERLRGQHERLAVLKIGDQEVRASFAVSWEALDEPLRRVFAQLGVFAGRAFRPPALGAVAELDEPAARDRLDALVGLSLLSVEGDQHYRQHPLLADFAREHLAQAEAADARMAQYFLSYATEQRQSYVALEQEWDNLAAGIQIAQQQKLWQAIIDYGDVLTNAWFALGRFSFARQVYPLVCGAARELEEQDPYIAATINWGRACIEQGDYAEAQERLQHALQTSREVSDQHGMAKAQFHLGRVAIEQSNHDEARKLLEDSQHLLEQLGDRTGAGQTLLAQARIQYRHYNYAEVERLAQQALEIFRATDQYQQTIEALRYLALAAAVQSDHVLPDQYCQKAMQLCDDVQYQAEVPSVLYTWMQLCYLRGDFALAKEYGERSITLYRTTGDRKSQAHALDYLARIYLDLQDYALAEERRKQSLAMTQELHDEWNIIYDLRGLGTLYLTTNRPDEARKIWTDALRKAESINHPLKDELRHLLEKL